MLWSMVGMGWKGEKDDDFGLWFDDVVGGCGVKLDKLFSIEGWDKMIMWYILIL